MPCEIQCFSHFHHAVGVYIYFDKEIMNFELIYTKFYLVVVDNTILYNILEVQFSQNVQDNSLLKLVILFFTELVRLSPK